MKVGLFDSGLGGLSVAQTLLEVDPNNEIFYYADFEFAPYGDQSAEMIQSRSFEIAQQLKERGAEVIVVACNTATAHAIDDLRLKMDIPFVGIEPFIKFLNSFSAESFQEAKVGVLVTPSLQESSRFQSLIAAWDQDQKTRVFSMPNLARLIDESGGEVDDQVLQKELGPVISYGPSHLLLGCTHYPLIQHQLERLLQTKCIHPNQAVAKQILRFKQQDDPSKLHFLSSKTLSKHLQEKIKALFPMIFFDKIGA